jgi:hypothetical protein
MSLTFLCFLKERFEERESYAGLCGTVEEADGRGDRVLHSLQLEKQTGYSGSTLTEAQLNFSKMG